MPSLLSCFCVHHRRHTFSSRKRFGRKKILNRNSDCISNTSSDFYHRQLSEGAQSQNSVPNVLSSDDSEILSRLLDRQSSPSRRHVGDIFREDPVIEPLPHLHSLNETPWLPSTERMNGYVPKAMGEMSASSALSGGKIDDFFSDCRLQTALSKFANSTEFNEELTSDFYTIDRTENKPSIVRVGSREESHFNLETPSLHSDVEEDNFKANDVISGSVSSDSLSLEDFEDDVDSRDYLKNDFIFPESSKTEVRYDTFDSKVEYMFHNDGDILY